jgi:hypothetical protein
MRHKNAHDCRAAIAEKRSRFITANENKTKVGHAHEMSMIPLDIGQHTFPKISNATFYAFVAFLG